MDIDLALKGTPLQHMGYFDQAQCLFEVFVVPISVYLSIIWLSPTFMPQPYVRSPTSMRFLSWALLAFQGAWAIWALHYSPTLAISTPGHIFVHRMAVTMAFLLSMGVVLEERTWSESWRKQVLQQASAAQPPRTDFRYLKRIVARVATLTRTPLERQGFYTRDTRVLNSRRGSKPSDSSSSQTTAPTVSTPEGSFSSQHHQHMRLRAQAMAGASSSASSATTTTKPMDIPNPTAPSIPLANLGRSGPSDTVTNKDLFHSVLSFAYYTLLHDLSGNMIHEAELNLAAPALPIPLYILLRGVLTGFTMLAFMAHLESARAALHLMHQALHRVVPHLVGYQKADWPPLVGETLDVLKGTSRLRYFWSEGGRWHSLFTESFRTIAYFVGKAMGEKMAMLSIFFQSAVLHAWAIYAATDNVLSAFKMYSFFIGVAVLILAEVAFVFPRNGYVDRLDRRLNGWLGRAWTFSTMLLLATITFADSVTDTGAYRDPRIWGHGWSALIARALMRRV